MTDIDDPNLETSLESQVDASRGDALFGPGFFLAVVRRLRQVWAVRHRVLIVDEIPASAPAGLLMMKAGDPNVYVGTGSGVRKWPTQAV